MSSIFPFLIFIFQLTLNGINSDANLRVAFLPFGNLASQFLGTIQPNNGLNITLKYINQLIGSSNLTSTPQTYINDLWSTYVGYIILVIIGLLFIFLFTLVGCCFCCCRCCCKKCGAKPPGASEENTKNKRIVFNVFLFLFTTMILIGGIISMASNVILLDAIKPSNDTTDKSGSILANIDTTAGLAISYMNYIANNALTSGITVLNTSMQNLLSLLSGVITIFTNTFFAQLNFGAIMNSTDIIINAYTNLSSQSKDLSSIASLHMNKTATYSQFLETVNQNLTNLLNSSTCQNSLYSDNCNQVSQLLPLLTIGYNYSNINYIVDINSQSVIGSFNISDLIHAKATVLNNSIDISNQVNSTINGYIQDFSKYLSKNSSIYQTFNNTVSSKDTLLNSLNTYKNIFYDIKLDGSITIQNGVIYNYYRWVFYGFIFLIGIILLVTLLFYVGLCFGICGGPNFEDSSCCSKGKGSGFFMGAVALSFIFGWLLMLIVIVMFLVGGLIETEACRYLSPKTNPSFIQTMDIIINNSLTQLNFSIPISNGSISLPSVNPMQSIMLRCPSSTDLISAFSIPTSFINSLSNTIFQQFVSPSLKTLVNNINNYAVPNINVNIIINSTNRIFVIVNQLKSINTTMTITELKKPVINLNDILSFIEVVKNLAKSTAQTSPEFSSGLMSSINNLNATVQDMNSTHTSYLNLKTSFITLYQSMPGPLQTLSDFLSILPSKTSDAKTAAFIAANATLVQNTTSMVNQTIFNVIISLGNCQGLSTTFFSGVSILCSTFLVPFNNLWMGIGWFLLFIIPAIIISLKLHQIYRITHIESNSSNHNKAYTTSNNFLSENDMAMIRMERPRKV